MSGERLDHHARLRVPQFDLRIFTSGCEPTSVRTEGDTTRLSIVVAGLCDELPGLRIPERHPTIGAGDPTSAIWAECDAFNLHSMFAELGDWLPGVGVPDSDQSVSADRGKSLTVRAKGDAQHTRRVSGDRGDFLARRRVPELHGLVIRCRRDSIARWAERHTANGGGVTFHGADDFARLRVPQPDRLVRPCRCKASTIGIDGESQHAAWMPVECGEFLSGGGIPQFDLPVTAC